MHQPYYEDLVTREHILPWVRLHALKDYWGMVAMLDEFPEVKTTFNLVPSLLVQLEAFAQDKAHDRYLELGLKPAHALMPDDVPVHSPELLSCAAAAHDRHISTIRGTVVAAGMGHERQRNRRRRPAVRYRRPARSADLAEAGLGGPGLSRARPARPGAGREGRHFSEEDKQDLRAIELELLNAVIPAYRRAIEAGNVEVSTSPFYHPILPLLCDTDIYKRTHPLARSPRQRFTRPDDALAQLEQAADYHERLFGRRPAGVWPSEGSVSDAVVPLIARAGFKWMATDEMILANTLATILDVTVEAWSNRPTACTVLPRFSRRRRGGVRVPRPRVVGPDRICVCGLAGSRRGR
jgi:hypothetical protein